MVIAIQSRPASRNDQALIRACKPWPLEDKPGFLEYSIFWWFVRSVDRIGMTVPVPCY